MAELKCPTLHGASLLILKQASFRAEGWRSKEHRTLEYCRQLLTSRLSELFLLPYFSRRSSRVFFVLYRLTSLHIQFSYSNRSVVQCLRCSQLNAGILILLWSRLFVCWFSISLLVICVHVCPSRLKGRRVRRPPNSDGLGHRRVNKQSELSVYLPYCSRENVALPNRTTFTWSPTCHFPKFIIRTGQFPPPSLKRARTAAPVIWNDLSWTSFSSQDYYILRDRLFITRGEITAIGIEGLPPSIEQILVVHLKLVLIAI